MTFIVREFLVADCHSVRSSIAASVDGNLETFAWNGVFREYNQPSGGLGVRYEYQDDDGLHITLAGPGYVNAVRVRGGAQVRLLGAGADWHGPGTAPLPNNFDGMARIARSSLDPRGETREFSFFDLQKGTLSDIEFL